MVNKNSIVIFGAGKIGRSFIGQLFGLADYSIVFIDIDKDLINALNHRNNYPVVIRGGAEEKTIIVPNVRAVSVLDQDLVAREVLEASLIAISIGKNALPKVIPLIAEGIKLRYQMNPDLPLDIILAENMRDAAGFMLNHLTPYLPDEYPANRLLGLVETSIGKMVPIIPDSEEKIDPLKVFAEPYNELIVDGKAFKGGIPDIKEIAPKNNIKAWVDRKAFIHNLGHATAAYAGLYHHPQAKFIWQVLEDRNIYNFTRDVIRQAAEILLLFYPYDFTMSDLDRHITDLLYRFQNRALGDTIFRVGMDLPRKLGKNDRFEGIIRMAVNMGMPYKKILKAMVYGFCFKGKNEDGLMYPSDINFLQNLSSDFTNTIVNVCGFQPEKDKKIIIECKILYKGLTNSTLTD